MKTDNVKFKQLFAEKLLLFIAEDAEARIPGKNKSFRRSFRNALKGLVFTFLSERNFRFELLAFIGALLLSAVLRIQPVEWVLVIQSGILVLAFEVKNTSTELTVDISTSEYNYGAKGSKDAASGAVLLLALNSVCVGLLIFAPYLIKLFKNLLSVIGGNQ